MSSENQVLEALLRDIEGSNVDLIQSEYSRVLDQFGSVNIKNWQAILKKLCTSYSIPFQLLNLAISKPKDSEHIDIDIALSQLVIFIKQKLIENKKLGRNQPKNDNKDIYEAFPFYTEEYLDEAIESKEDAAYNAPIEFQKRLDKFDKWLNETLEKDDPINIFRNLLVNVNVNADESQIQNFIKDYENWKEGKNAAKSIFGGGLFGDEETDQTQPTEVTPIRISLAEFKSIANNWFLNNNPELIPQNSASPIQQNKKKLDQKDHLNLMNFGSSPRLAIKSSEMSVVSKSSPSPFGGSVQTFGATGDSQFPYAEFDEFQIKLQKTISDYEQIKYEKTQNNEDTSIIETLLKSLKTQLKKSQEKYPRKRISKEKPLIERFKSGIHEVFNFYACQQNLLGLHQNFELIKKNSETLNLGKFTIFCKDFSILDISKNPNKKSLPKKAIKQIFIKNAINHREMNEEVFIKVLDSMALLFLDAEYDSINGTDFKDQEPADKKYKFYEILGFHDPQIYLKKCKGFSQPFGPDLLTRIPADDIANKFDLKKKQKLKQSVQEWKKTKQSEQDNKQRKSSTHVIAHSVPSDAIIFARKVVPSPPETYKAKMARKNSDPITWKGLGNMQPNELVGEEEFKYENLIIEDDSSTDEYLKKEYPLENTPSQAIFETMDSDKKETNISPSSLLKPQNKISNKTLKRAGELSEVSKRNEEKIIQKGLKLSNARMERLNKYATKFKKL
ncbi:unnamed protein product [Blepharisma stoltei]|uniref:Uncharacterized protein n=1 Tax=Blepharisma stoltei TaxID=1481888 RepID=A0AAU9I8Q1_9CILI|nr:unnamed protein product [Blepharisma stoltei]